MRELEREGERERARRPPSCFLQLESRCNRSVRASLRLGWLFETEDEFGSGGGAVTSANQIYNHLLPSVDRVQVGGSLARSLACWLGAGLGLGVRCAWGRVRASLVCQRGKSAE